MMSELSKEPSPTLDGTILEQCSYFAINGISMFIEAAATYNKNAKNKTSLDFPGLKVSDGYSP